MHGLTAEDGGVRRLARRVADENKLAVPPGSPLFRELVEAVKRALDEHYGREVARLQGQPGPGSDPFFAGIGAEAPPVRVLTLKEAIEAFMAAPEKAGRAAKTVAAWKFRFAAIFRLPLRQTIASSSPWANPGSFETIARPAELRDLQG